MADQTTAPELDVRPLRKPDKHPTIFATYATLPAGGRSYLSTGRPGARGHPAAREP